jgi:hypothetical protein
VAATLGADAVWWHKHPQEQFYGVAPGELPDCLLGPLDDAAARLAELTAGYGYQQPGRSRQQLREVAFPPALLTGVRQYDQLKREAEQLKRRLYTLTRPPFQRKPR